MKTVVCPRSLGDPFVLGNERITVSVSIGPAVFPEEGETREELMCKADADMYARKERDIRYSESAF